MIKGRDLTDEEIENEKNMYRKEAPATLNKLGKMSTDEIIDIVKMKDFDKIYKKVKDKEI